MTSINIIIFDYDDTLLPSCITQRINSNLKEEDSKLQHKESNNNNDGDININHHHNIFFDNDIYDNNYKYMSMPKSIIPNSWTNNIDDEDYLRKEKEKEKEEIEENLHKLDTLLCSIFHQYILDPNTYVYIVTNSQTGWVANSSFDYLPKFNHFIQEHNTSQYRFCIISARDKFESMWPNDPVMWKVNCFDEICKKHQQQNHKIANLISIGDGEPELRALDIVSERYNILGKSILFIVHPKNLEQIIQQLEITYSVYPFLKTMPITTLMKMRYDDQMKNFHLNKITGPRQMK